MKSGFSVGAYPFCLVPFALSLRRISPPRRVLFIFPIGSYPVEDGLYLDVVDPTLRIDDFNDITKVEKFEISKDEYEKREDSVAAFKVQRALCLLSCACVFSSALRVGRL